jgi:membrane protease YdiL (CAAX protease family)
MEIPVKLALKANFLETLTYLPSLFLAFLFWLALSKGLWRKRSFQERLIECPSFSVFLIIWSILFLLSAFIRTIASSYKNAQIMMLFLQVFGVFLMFKIWKTSCKKFPKGFLPLSRQLFFALLHFLALYPLLIVAFSLNTQWSIDSHPMIHLLSDPKMDFGSFLIFIFSLTLIVPVYEELLYRGLLQNSLQKFVGFIPALILQCLLFTSLHPLNSALPIFLLSLSLTAITFWSKSLFPGIFMHMLFNGLTCLELTFLRFNT